MGTGFRIFFVHDDGSIQRFPLARFERIMNHDSNECLPEYAGKRVRYALVTVDLENREPVEITGIGYNILTLDSEGRLDVAEFQQEMRLWIDSMPIEGPKRISRKVIDAEPLFIDRRYRSRYRWEPTPEIEKAIVAVVFGKQ